MSWVVDFSDVGNDKRSWQLCLESPPHDAIAALRDSVEQQGCLKGPAKAWRFSFNPDGGCGFITHGNRQVGQFAYYLSHIDPPRADSHEEPAPIAEPDPNAPRRMTRRQLAEQTPAILVVFAPEEHEVELLRDRVITLAADLVNAHERLRLADSGKRRRAMRFEVASAESYLFEAIESAAAGALAPKASEQFFEGGVS